MKQLLLSMAAVLLLAACGGDIADRGSEFSTGGSGSTPTGGSTTGGGTPTTTGGTTTGGTTTGGTTGGTGGTPATALIKVLSNRSDLLNAGDALIEVVFTPASAHPQGKVLLNDVDVTSQFAQRANDRYMGRLEGIPLGSSTLRVQLPGVADATHTLSNYPNEGPIFSGPHRPWSCREASATDVHCNQPPQYTLLYKSSNPDTPGLFPYDPDEPPEDLAMTTTDNGKTLPFIVRQERGYQDRDEYKYLVLYQPGMDWQPWAPQPQWLRKLLVTHGGNCGADYRSEDAPLEDYAGTIPSNPGFEQSYIVALGRGFAVMSTALDNTGHNCDVPLGAESLMMAKERFIEQYGELRYTIGTGCSGGSIAQATIANAYPGIYQGLLTMCSYPDTFSAGVQFTDYHLLRKFFEVPSKWGVPWTPQQFADVAGHIAYLNVIAADELLYKAAIPPTGDCLGPASYHPTTNPGGQRCGVIEYMPEIFGSRDESVWSPNERALGRGFTGLPLGNSGVEYGLVALQQGKITPAHFVDINQKIGGLTVDIEHQAARTKADPLAVQNIYRSGTVNMANHLNTAAIINFTGPDPGIAHDSVHAWWTRWRLEARHGNHNNHIMWAGPTPLVGDFNYVYDGLTAMDQWLTEVEKDTSDMPIAEKLSLRKPATLTDRCSDGSGQKQADEACVVAAEAATAYQTPRVVGGGLRESDSMECVLKPFARDTSPTGKYGAVPFTEAQWVALETLFKDGVCDYSKPPLLQGLTERWLTYQDAAGKVIIGGRPLPAVPANSQDGWASPAFRY